MNRTKDNKEPQLDPELLRREVIAAFGFEQFRGKYGAIIRKGYLPVCGVRRMDDGELLFMGNPKGISERNDAEGVSRRKD